MTSDKGSEETFGDIEDRNPVRIIVGKTQETGIPTLKISNAQDCKISIAYGPVSVQITHSDINHGSEILHDVLPEISKLFAKMAPDVHMVSGTGSSRTASESADCSEASKMATTANYAVSDQSDRKETSETCSEASIMAASSDEADDKWRRPRTLEEICAEATKQRKNDPDPSSFSSENFSDKKCSAFPSEKCAIPTERAHWKRSVLKQPSNARMSAGKV